MRIAAEHLWDGDRWCADVVVVVDGTAIRAVERAGAKPGAGPAAAAGPADLRCRLLLPGLVDCGVLAEGYLEGPNTAQPFLPEEAFASLCLASGVTTVVDVGASLGPVTHLRDVAGTGAGPRILAAGVRLVSRPSRRADVRVRPGEVAPWLEALAAVGAPLISIGAAEDDLRAAALSAARARRLPVVIAPSEHPGLEVWRARSAADQAGAAPQDPCGETAQRWLIPQVEARSHWTVDGLLTVVGAERGRAFLPYARHFQRQRGFVGRRIARDVLTRLYGDRAAGDDPDEVLRTAAAGLVDGTVLAASGAGGAGLVPGDSLWAELARFALAAGNEAALRSATGSAAKAFDPTVGVVRPGASADLVLCDASPADGPAAWRGGLHTVVRAGRAWSVADVEERVRVLTDDAERLLI